ncbi:MAG TPA: methylase, partial [Porphyromonadaceae bacterium]|nr:methylase [Porphyromonadaceae bacterium]
MSEQFFASEKRVNLSHKSYIDIYLPETKVLIEQKSIDIDLLEPKKQSDGSLLNPFQQAKRYASELIYSERVRWIVTCNFKTFLIYDMDNEQGKDGKKFLRIDLEDLPEHVEELKFLVVFRDEKIIREQELSIKVGEFIGKLYDGLIKQYRD